MPLYSPFTINSLLHFIYNIYPSISLFAQNPILIFDASARNLQISVYYSLNTLAGIIPTGVQYFFTIISFDEKSTYCVIHILSMNPLSFDKHKSTCRTQKDSLGACDPNNYYL